MKAKCEYCGKVMLESDGCDDGILTLNDGKDYKRIAVGDEFDYFYEIADEDFRCHDCNAAYGEYHHSGCDCEVCPKCHEQFIGCDC